MSNNNELTIYLGGKMSGLSYEKMNTWRLEVKTQLYNIYKFTAHKKINVINPVDYYNFEFPRHKTEKEVMMFDLAKVKSSDIIVVNLDGLNSSIGTCIEIYEAYRREIPVLVFGDNDEYEKLHPWIKECVTRVDETYLDTCEYIKDFYML